MRNYKNCTAVTKFAPQYAPHSSSYASRNKMIFSCSSVQFLFNFVCGHAGKVIDASFMVIFPFTFSSNFSFSLLVKKICYENNLKM